MPAPMPRRTRRLAFDARVWQSTPTARTRDPSTAAGFRRVMFVLLVVALSFGATYVVPGLERFRPWVSGEPVPFSGIFSPRDSPLIVEQGGEQTAALDVLADGREAGWTAGELLSAAPLPGVPEPAGDPEDLGADLREAPPGDTADPVYVAGSASGAAPGARGPAAATTTDRAPPPPRIPKSALEGMTREVEFPTGEDAMEHFHAALARTAEGIGDGKARIVVYSTSTNRSDLVTWQLRRTLAEHFGDGGKGWVIVSPAWHSLRHEDVVWSHRGWKTFAVNRNSRSDGRYGLGGIMAQGGAHARAAFGTVAGGPVNTTVGRYEIHYQAFPRGGKLALLLDGEEQVPLDTSASVVEDRVHELLVPEGPHNLQMQVKKGRVRLYGVVMERSTPGVVVDAMILIGAYARRLSHFDREHIAGQVAQRRPDLFLFWIGANDVASRSRRFVPGRFEDEYVEGIARIRAGRPEASCLLMSVMDQGIEERGRVVSRELGEMIAAQRSVAKRTGCAFFNTFEAIGGKGTMKRWRQATPKLVTGDYGHLTPAGSRVVGALLGKALLAAYDGWAARR